MKYIGLHKIFICILIFISMSFCVGCLNTGNPAEPDEAAVTVSEDNYLRTGNMIVSIPEEL